MTNQSFFWQQIIKICKAATCYRNVRCDCQHGCCEGSIIRSSCHIYDSENFCHGTRSVYRGSSSTGVWVRTSKAVATRRLESVSAKQRLKSYASMVLHEFLGLECPFEHAARRRWKLHGWIMLWKRGSFISTSVLAIPVRCFNIHAR